MKTLIFYPLVFIASLGVAFAQKQSLNGVWQFKTDRYKQGIKQEWYSPDFQALGWDKMVVPSNWDLENEYADYVGVAWYRRTFDKKSEWQGKRIRLYFESVYNDCEVWLNGQKVAENHLGFLPFWVDIQDKLEAENVLVVRVDNTFKRGAIWNWGGIRRPVWLEVTPMARLEYQHITAVPDLVKGTAEVGVNFKTSNSDETSQTLGYKFIVYNPKGEVVFQTEKKNALEIPAKSDKETVFKFNLKKKDVELWHFNQPNLYTAKLELLQEGKVIHQLNDRFGIRKIEIDGYAFKLNGETVRTVGFNLVPEERTTGNTLPLWRIKEDVDLMKQMGANMARLSHLPLPKEFLNYLDEKGIMTFEEVSLWGKDEMVDPEHPTPKEWLERMVQHKYNHPSIIGWSIGNEIGYVRDNPKVMEYVKTASLHAKTLDPTRLAINVSHSAQAQEKDPVEFSDMILYNRYGSWGKDAEKTNQLHPNKPIFMAEYGKELNREDPNDSFINAKLMLDDLRNREYVMGASLWTFNDYRSFWKSKPTWTTPPSQNRTWGMVTSLREKKKSFYEFKKEYAPVKSMQFQVDEGKSSGKVILTPRRRLDIPAYSMKGYRLLWSEFDEKGNVTGGSFSELPEIKPDDAPQNIMINWAGDNAIRMEIHLLDPQDYSVLDTMIYLQKPQVPKILSVHTSEKKARVVFESVENAKTYALRYRMVGEEWQQSPSSINQFLEVEKLKGFQEYEFAVVAINSAGESEPSKIIKASTDEDELPPIIWKTVPADKAFFIGYSVNSTDYLYEVAYGTQSRNYTDTLIIQNVGVCKIPNLENNQTYFYKMRLRKQWGFASEWSHEISITPDGGKANGEVKIQGVVSDGKKSIILFETVEKARGYLLETKEGKTFNITSAQNGFFSFEGNYSKNELSIKTK